MTTERDAKYRLANREAIMARDRERARLRREANKLPPAPVLAVPASSGLQVNPDAFKGIMPNDYYRTTCVFCGCPDSKLLTRNGFKGYLCFRHSFE